MLSFENYCGWVPRLQMRGVFDARSGSAAKHLPALTAAWKAAAEAAVEAAVDLVGPLGDGSVSRFETAHGQDRRHNRHQGRPIAQPVVLDTG